VDQRVDADPDPLSVTADAMADMATTGTARHRLAAPLRSEGGFALLGTVLVMVMITALGSAALYLGQLDLTLAGNYRAQRAAEVAADGSLDLVKAMIYGNSAQLNLPLGIPSDGTAATWQRAATYTDADLDVSFTIKYKQEDNINYNTTETYVDEVVRYGKDYRYQAAQKDIGKQPVFTVTYNDARTGVKGEADLISTIGFRTPSAIFCGGRVHMQKYQWATEESIEVTSGAGTPAVATASANVADITIETVRESTPIPGATATTGSYNAINTSGTTGINYAINALYLHPRVYRPSEVQASKAAGQYNQAREKAHILLGVGERDADLNALYTGAGGGAAGVAAVNAKFRFFNRTADGLGSAYDSPVLFAGTPTTCDGIVCYGYPMPAAGGGLTSLEGMLGQSFVDLKSLRDEDCDPAPGNQPCEFTCNSTVALPTGGTSNYGCNFGGKTLGTAAAPKVVFINSTGNTQPVTLVTRDPVTNAATQVSGYGILVIDDDADIVGSINWTGLMIIKGNMTFRPWQGGTAALRSGPDLSTRWNGFLIIGADLDLWTYWGGSILLGYNTNEAAAIKGIISATVPHKVVSWRRAYN
jgi:hypothetical protein